MTEFSFELISSSAESSARRGRLRTRRGEIQTPVFMPVGTQATVKGILPETLKELGTQIILANTYHLFLRPGHDLVRDLGGVHGFMNWDRPILTDSGGFQVFSLSDLRKITEEGVLFQSHLNGARHHMTPELSVAVQEALGADILMAFDECIPFPADRSYAADATERSTRWALRSKRARTPGNGSALFGIIQGSMYTDLRAKSAADLVELDFEGYAVGGLSVGEGDALMYDMMEFTLPLLPADRPRYVMGIGTPENLVEAVFRGADMFDCVLPTRNARNGVLFTSSGRLSIKQSRYTRDPSPIDESCSCYVCRHYSRAYLRHLYLCNEILSSVLNTHHNLHYYHNLMESIRKAVENDSFAGFRNDFYRRREVPVESN